MAIFGRCLPQLGSLLPFRFRIWRRMKHSDAYWMHLWTECTRRLTTDLIRQLEDTGHGVSRLATAEVGSHEEHL